MVTWLEANLTDPYESVTEKERSNFVYGDDFTLVPLWPKIQVDLASFDPVKVNSQTKTNYLEEEIHTFMIYYYNDRVSKYTFADNGLKLAGEAQCVKFLQYIRDTLKANMTDFSDYFHNATFGAISKPRFKPTSGASGVFVGAIPFAVTTFRR